MQGIYNIPGRTQQFLSSSTIVFVRPAPENKESDYEILFLERNEKLLFGGWYAFPGGNLEKNDRYERWEKNMPEFIEKSGKHYYDFNKRISAIRESFEEVNFLLSDKNLEKG
jgi:8-oxo-dGTP pyrophosphatase MutT (NUDIX family)